MHVILDTNVLYQDLSLEGASLQALFSGCQLLPALTLVIPQVVIDESLVKFEHRLAESIDQDRKVRATLENLVLRHMPARVGKEELQAERARFEARLIARLRGVQATILPYPEAAHPEIALRAMTRREPFKKSGDGYRDTLIWLSILEAIDRADIYDDVVFLTENVQDFGKGPLDASLLTELCDRGFEEPFRVEPSIKQFNKEHVLPGLKKRDELMASLSDDSHPTISIRRWAREDLPESVASRDLLRSLFHVSDPVGVARLEVAEVLEVEVSNVFDLGDGRILVHGSVVIAGESVARFDWRDVDASREIAELIGSVHPETGKLL